MIYTLTKSFDFKVQQCIYPDTQHFQFHFLIQIHIYHIFDKLSSKNQISSLIKVPNKKYISLKALPEY